MSFLTIDDLHVSYKREDKKRAYAVQGLSIELGRQETLGIVGETGAGKTTTALSRQWMEEVNRWSVHSVSERLLEANKRGMWNTDAETLRRIQMIYMQAEGAIEEVSE